MIKNDIINIIKKYPNKVKVDDPYLRDSYERNYFYDVDRSNMREAIEEIGIENILANENYVKAITTQLGKGGYYVFISEFNRYYHNAVHEKDSEKLKKTEFLKSQEFAESLTTRRYEADDFITYSIAFFEDADIISNVIKVASKDDKNKGAIYRGINGMQQFYTKIAAARYPGMNITNIPILTPMVELEFNQKIMNSIIENVENKANAVEFIKELSSKTNKIIANQREAIANSIEYEIRLEGALDATKNKPSDKVF